MARTIIGLFDDRHEAQQVVQEVAALGIPGNRTSILEERDMTPAGTTEPARESEETGFWGRIQEAFGFGIPGTERSSYEGGIRRGGTLVSVGADENQVDRVVDAMNRHGAVDIDQRSAQWRAAGWTGLGGAQKGETVLPVVEEELQVGKREVQRGGVRVYSHVTDSRSRRRSGCAMNRSASSVAPPIVRPAKPTWRPSKKVRSR